MHCSARKDFSLNLNRKLTEKGIPSILIPKILNKMGLYIKECFGFTFNHKLYRIFYIFLHLNYQFCFCNLNSSFLLYIFFSILEPIINFYEVQLNKM